MLKDHRPMEQRQSTSEGQSGAPSTMPAAPPWLRHTTQHPPDRRARMLDHMARARSVPQPKAATAPEPARKGGIDILRDAFGCMILSGIIAFLFQSRVPLYLGAFLFLTDGERIENALRAIGIRFEPGAIGPDIVKAFVSLFGWFALLASLRASVPAWLAAWMPPADSSWSFIAGIALAFAVAEAFATLAMRHALPWFGFEIRADGLIWSTIKLVMAIGALALLMLLGNP
jgi:hypothetical protein